MTLLAAKNNPTNWANHAVLKEANENRSGVNLGNTIHSFNIKYLIVKSYVA